MKREVAILIFDDVEVLDFTGPFEVFAVTDELSGHLLFDVHTLAPQAGPIRSRNGLTVVPDFTLDSAPRPDMLLVPGGNGSKALLDQPTVLEWIKRHSQSAEVLASVCTGARLLAKTGLLDGLTATTHHECFAELRALAPRAHFREDVRFTDNGQVLTSAGIAAGIDLSLHIVARLLGEETARKTATYMEYPWVNDGGKQR